MTVTINKNKNRQHTKNACKKNLWMKIQTKQNKETKTIKNNDSCLQMNRCVTMYSFYMYIKTSYKHYSMHYWTTVVLQRFTGQDERRQQESMSRNCWSQRLFELKLPYKTAVERNTEWSKGICSTGERKGCATARWLARSCSQNNAICLLVLWDGILTLNAVCIWGGNLLPVSLEHSPLLLITGPSYLQCLTRSISWMWL